MQGRKGPGGGGGWWVAGTSKACALRLQAVPFRQPYASCGRNAFSVPVTVTVTVTRPRHPSPLPCPVLPPRRPRRVCTPELLGPIRRQGKPTASRDSVAVRRRSADATRRAGTQSQTPQPCRDVFAQSCPRGSCAAAASSVPIARQTDARRPSTSRAFRAIPASPWPTGRADAPGPPLCRRAYSNSPDRRNSNGSGDAGHQASRGLPPTVGLPSRSRWAARKFPCRRAAVGRVLLRRAAIGGVVFGRRLLTLALSIRFFLAAASAIAIGGFAGATIGSGFLLSAIAACGSVHLLLDGAAGRLLRCRLVAGPAANLALALLVGLRAAFIGGRVLTGAAGARFVCLLTAALFTVPGAIAGRFALLIGLLLAYAGRLGLVALPLTRCFACLARLLWTRQIVGLRRRASCAIIGLLAGA